ncbi:MAG: CDP-diacylglycerol--glycerol-3-phosphate 3-phosphatidyltransferase [Oscillospiraceae bacterium]|nr:CDP-diacylglycerol--glycerol-3-phosphate 3-phosphatidyltransferase [Oscillospiraceae bacterium]
MNTPNILTIIRMIFVPVFILLLLYVSRIAACAVFVLASLTDWLDGYLARKNNEITNFGKFMDPLADKMLVTSALVCFVGLGWIPAWVAMIVIGRDLAVDGLRMVAASRNIVMAAGWSGKVKTAVTMVLIPVMLVFGETGVGILTINNISALIIVALNIISMVDYFMKNGKVILE